MDCKFKLTIHNYMVCGNVDCKFGYGDSTPSERNNECMFCYVQQVPASQVPFDKLHPAVQKVYRMLEETE